MEELLLELKREVQKFRERTQGEKNSKAPKEIKEGARILFSKGKSVKEISKELGFSLSAVAKWTKKSKELKKSSPKFIQVEHSPETIISSHRSMRPHFNRQVVLPSGVVINGLTLDEVIKISGRYNECL